MSLDYKKLLTIRFHTKLSEDDVQEIQTSLPIGFENLQREIASLTGVEPEDQCIFYGECGYRLNDDHDLKGLVLRENLSKDTAVDVFRLSQITSWRTEPSWICTKLYLGDRAAVQPAYFIPGSEKLICYPCAQLCFPPELLVAQVGTLKPFVCSSSELCVEGLGTYFFHEADFSKLSNGDVQTCPSLSLLAFLADLQNAAFRQQGSGSETQRLEGLLHMRRRLESGWATFHAYESFELQTKALSEIPLNLLHQRALQAGGDPDGQPKTFRDFLFRELLAWFKHEFFRWVDRPCCDYCQNAETALIGGAMPTAEEAKGKAGRVEVYACNRCQKQTRFPRFNEPGRLLETRRGRCGEWANCFTLCCVAMGFQSRYVLDWTDHVWTEVYSEAEGRWLHADSCENRSDVPYMYESGWGKKLSYVMAFGSDGVVDVTRRYTKCYDEVLTRRSEVPELGLGREIQALNEHIKTRKKVATGSSLSEEVYRCEQYELQHSATLGNTSRRLLPFHIEELQGRISGDMAWKRIRGETGECMGPLESSSYSAEADAESLFQRAQHVSVSLQSGVAEKEELMEWPVDPTNSGHLIVAATSRLGGSDVITVNGIEAAVGLRGLNIVIVDLNRAVISRSLVFDVLRQEKKFQKSVVEDLQNFLVTIQPDSLVVAVLVGSSGNSSSTIDLAPILCPTGGAPPKPDVAGTTSAWAFIGKRNERFEIIRNLVSTDVQTTSFVRLLWRLPLRKKNWLTHASSTTSSNNTINSSKEAFTHTQQREIWEDAIPTVPLCHEELVDSAFIDPETFFQEKGETLKAPLIGYAYKEGLGLVLVGETSGVRTGEGWTTVLNVKRGEALPDDDDDDPKVVFKDLFDELLLQGVPANSAAAQALLKMKEKTQVCGDRGKLERLVVRWTAQHGGENGSSSKLSWKDVDEFDDVGFAIPFLLCPFEKMDNRMLRLSKLKIWTSAEKEEVVGLQSGYYVDQMVSGGGSSDKAVMWGPTHGCCETYLQEHLWDMEEDAAEVDRIELWIGKEGGIKALSLVTRRQKRYSTLCERDSLLLQQGGMTCVVEEITQGCELIGFHGAVHQKKRLCCLGLIQALIPSSLPPSSSSRELSFPATQHPWGIFTTCAIDRIAHYMLVLCDYEVLKPLKALRAARRYIINCIKEPTNEKFRLVRVRSAFFHDNIGSLPGSGLLMAALGFLHVCGSTEKEACYQLPLHCVSVSSLQQLVDRLDCNIERLEILAKT